MGEFVLNASMKKKLFELYNEVNKDVYGFGTNEAKIFFVDNMIIFHVQHNRVPCLVALERDYPTIKEITDAAIMKVFKERLSQRLEEALHIRSKAVLRDYNADNLIASTIVILDR
ncbi:MAG: Na-translocating system protein MpsC family protein [Oscillospiraceae bacterium]|nr:Na-translocating system protein MpsC family protein [Oscillospiraceae bacterium]